MSTTRAIAHNTIIQIVGKAISTGLGLAAIAMMTRYLGQTQFGWYITTISFLQFVAILIDFGIIPVSAQLFGKGDYSEKRLLGNLLGFRLSTAVVFLGIAPLIALFFPYPNEVKFAIGFTTLSFLGVAINQVFTGYYQSKLQMWVHSLGEVIGRIVLVGGLWLAINAAASFYTIMWLVVAGSLSYTATMWLVAGRQITTRPRFEFSVWRYIIRAAWPIAIAIMFNVVYLKGDVLLLSWFRPQAEVGVYGAAYRVIDIIAQVSMMIMGLMLPLMAAQWKDKKMAAFRHQYQQAIDAIMLLALPTTIGLAMLADKIMIFVAGTDFVAAGTPLRILALAVFGVFLGTIFGHTIVAIDKQHKAMWIYLSTAVLTLAGYLWAIPRFGMLGAAWMTVFSELYTGIALFIMVRHYTKLTPQIKTVMKILFASIVMAAMLLITQNQHLFTQVIVGGATFAFFAYSLGAVSPQTIREIVKK